MQIHNANIYLGFDWLQHFNPSIDWKSILLSTSEAEWLNAVQNIIPLPEGIPLEYMEFTEVFTQENFNQFPPQRI